MASLSAPGKPSDGSDPHLQIDSKHLPLCVDVEIAEPTASGDRQGGRGAVLEMGRLRRWVTTQAGQGAVMRTVGRASSTLLVPVRSGL